MSDNSCTSDPVTCWIASQVDILTNIANTLGPIQKLITGASYLIGIAFGMKAIYCLKVYGESRTMMSGNTSLKEPLLYLLVAGMMIYVPTGVSVVMSSTFGYANILSYAPVSSGNAVIDTLFGADSAVGRPLAFIIQTIGVFAFVRGWVLVARSGSQGQQPGGTTKGLMHVFGGILAMNIIGTLEVVNNTLYGG